MKKDPRGRSCKIWVNHPLVIIVIASGRTNIFFLIASAPTFAMNQLKKTIIVTKDREVIIDCKPQGSPKPAISWRKGDKAVRENKRLEVYFIYLYFNLLISTFLDVIDDTYIVYNRTAIIVRYFIYVVILRKL
jgi:hypothetical protein